MIKLLFCLVFCVVAMRRSLQSNIDKWKSIGASDTVINWINEGVKFPLLGEVNSFEFPNAKFSTKETRFLETEINSLLLQGCINIADNKPKCISPITCVPKKNEDFMVLMWSLLPVLVSDFR